MSQEPGVVEDRIGYAVKRLQQAFRAAAEGRLRPLGLTMPQYAALSVLVDQPGASNSELARRCFVTRQTMNEVLGGLQRVGLIDREAHPRDGRMRQTALTANARDVLAQADRTVGTVEQRMTKGLNASERQQLLALLQNCTESLQGQPS